MNTENINEDSSELPSGEIGANESITRRAEPDETGADPSHGEVASTEVELVYTPRPEYGLHWSLLIGGLVVLVLSFLMTSSGESSVFMPGASVAMPELCSTRKMFGINCPGCGLTRAFISISKGQFAKAWGFNPASFFVYFLVIGQVPWQALQVWRIHQGRGAVQSRWTYIIPAIAATLLIAQWIIRIGFPT